MTSTYPDDLLYHPEHDWARVDGDTAEFGITWYAQDAIGDVVFFDPPETGAMLVAGTPYGELESVKAVSDIVAPLDGEVLAINQEVVDQPELVNTDPYSAWLVRIRITDPSQASSLLSPADYAASIDA